VDRSGVAKLGDPLRHALWWWGICAGGVLFAFFDRPRFELCLLALRGQVAARDPIMHVFESGDAFLILDLLERLNRGVGEVSGYYMPNEQDSL
jgi:hypothetical protein